MAHLHGRINTRADGSRERVQAHRKLQANIGQHSGHRLLPGLPKGLVRAVPLRPAAHHPHNQVQMERVQRAHETRDQRPPNEHDHQPGRQPEHQRAQLPQKLHVPGDNRAD